MRHAATGAGAVDEARLNRTILDAHADGASGPLARLYAEVADLREAEGAADAACYYLTQAYVYALDAQDPLAASLHARLKARGREE